ncbi:hypothetical protein ACFL0Q_04625 [Thermodesulfobacteriota bacterium]
MISYSHLAPIAAGRICPKLVEKKLKQVHKEKNEAVVTIVGSPASTPERIGLNDYP